jgi:hypothetical protein
MRLKISSSTDHKHLGEEFDVPSESFGSMTKKQIQAFTGSIYGGIFIPDKVLYLGDPIDRVRLVNSNYSVTFEDITSG